MRVILAFCIFIIAIANISAQEKEVDPRVTGKTNTVNTVTSPVNNLPVSKSSQNNLTTPATSKVMEYAFRLTDWSGPRLTGSPGFLKAANWAKQELTAMGLKNARLEPWGEFGKGWELDKCYLALTKPYYQPIIAYPKAWTGSTPGNRPLKAGIVLVRANDSTELAKYAGKLEGKIVMLWSSARVGPSFSPDASRYSDLQLDSMANKGPDLPRGERPENNVLQPSAAANSKERAIRMSRFSFQRQVDAFLAKEKAALILSMNQRGTDGTLFVGSGGSYNKTSTEAPASVMLSSDDFLRIQRLVEAGVAVELEAEIKTRFFTGDLNGYNVLAELPGTDPALKDEIVMLGAHLDSWHAATGATDNAAGCAVMMEALRIIRESGIQPRRTIRIALWGGEEQGLLGSRNYVKKNFADPATMELKPAHEKISAYYNLDNGTGRIRGIYLQGNKEVAKLFSSWLIPFHSQGAKTITITNTSGTDHLSFDAVGIPGFQFIQDVVEYNTRTHHTNMDTYDHLVAEDLQQASVIVAAFVLNTAQLDQKLPRKELPKPVTGRSGF